MSTTVAIDQFLLAVPSTVPASLRASAGGNSEHCHCRHGARLPSVSSPSERYLEYSPFIFLEYRKKRYWCPLQALPTPHLTVVERSMV